MIMIDHFPQHVSASQATLMAIARIRRCLLPAMSTRRRILSHKLISEVMARDISRWGIHQAFASAQPIASSL